MKNLSRYLHIIIFSKIIVEQPPGTDGISDSEPGEYNSSVSDSSSSSDSQDSEPETITEPEKPENESKLEPGDIRTMQKVIF